MASMCAASQLGEANAAAPCSDTSSEKGRIAGYRTNKHPAMIRAAALRRTRDAMTDGAIVVLFMVISGAPSKLARSRRHRAQVRAVQGPLRRRGARQRVYPPHDQDDVPHRRRLAVVWQQSGQATDGQVPWQPPCILVVVVNYGRSGRDRPVPPWSSRDREKARVQGSSRPSSIGGARTVAGAASAADEPVSARPGT